ncbi:MAG: acetate kinase, partial [Cyanobacteria bacterium J06641_5]
SSSQKSCLYEFGDVLPSEPPPPLWEGAVDWTGKSGVVCIEVETASGATLETELADADRTRATEFLLGTLCQGKTKVLESLNDLDAIGHRVVHGGDRYQQAALVTPEVCQVIEELCPLAPVHNPVNLQGIETIAAQLPDVPQVAVFDTAFHSQMPAAAATYPLPQEFFARGMRCYGFHGISHEYCLQRVAQLMDRAPESLQLITCHLGNGCSLAAIRDGISVDTTMGYTPLEGLMMGTRSGSVDPGLLLQLLREGYDVDELDRLLNQESGLKGLSGVGADMRQIMAAIAQGNTQAQLALDVYLHRLRAGIGAMLGSLDRLDALVFTAGIGEHAAVVRAEGTRALAALGVKLDPGKNAASPRDTDIATADSSARVLVIHTQEDWAIARSTWLTLA